MCSWLQAAEHFEAEKAGSPAGKLEVGTFMSKPMQKPNPSQHLQTSIHT